MSDPYEHILQSLQFYQTSEYPCSYLPDEQARSLVAAPAHLIDNNVYSNLVAQGFRRSGLFTYRPDCRKCQACMPIRIDVSAFNVRRSHKRVIKKNSNLISRSLPLQWNDEHYELYVEYQRVRHPGAGMDTDTEKQYKQFLLSSAVDSRLIEFRDQAGKVQIIALTDILDNSLSAVYTFYNPLSDRSLGTYSILWQIMQCKSLDMPWLYLGYWIQNSRKMAYKSQFKPYQLLVNGQWSYVD